MRDDYCDRDPMDDLDDEVDELLDAYPERTQAILRWRRSGGCGPAPVPTEVSETGA